MSEPGPAVIWCFATQGSGSGDERRIQELLEPLGVRTWPFDRAAKRRSARRLFAALVHHRPDLVVMEGTGVAGGAAVLAGRLRAGVPYVVSSGDAVGPYVRLARPGLAPAAGAYERALCRLSAGYIGWSPYLVGRALTFGTPRAMTAANWPAAGRPEDREACRRRLGLPEDAIVFGLVGSIDWSAGPGYCYGLELVAAVRAVRRRDVRVVVVGDGSGLERLRELAGDDLGKRVLLPGRVPREQVPSYLSAFDIASLPQSVDGVGSFRYTTKLSEYLAAGLPVVTGEVPLAYDLDDGWLWRLPGDAPWSPAYLAGLRGLMTSISREDIAARRGLVPADLPLFDGDRQRRQVCAFVESLLRDGDRPFPDGAGSSGPLSR